MSADALPTVQQNGVVWAQVTVGNIVYATGSFSQTWPGGASRTAANSTARSNLLAYDITTGNLVTSFNHNLNAQGLAIAASPNGARVYVSGDFTTVDGQARSRMAAFDTATGALDTSFKPSFNSQVHAVTATNTTVYAGGIFTTVNGIARFHLAALNATNGVQLSNWTPTVELNVYAMVVTPDQSEVVIGGPFQTLNGANVYGLGAVTTANGTSVPYAINNYVRDYTPATHPAGQGAAIMSLATDGTQIYGSGYSYYLGNFEGNFGVSPNTGTVNFINDCHGDTYSVFPIGQALYTASHNHSCQWIGDFPNTTPTSWHRSLAFTTYPTGKNTGPDDYGWNYAGLPDSTLLHWYPTLLAGSVTGQNQAAWSVTGNSNYVALGGEFPSVNGVAQAGLTRFAVSSKAPNRSGPLANSAALTPKVTAVSSTSAGVSWSATWDFDNQALTYRVYRDGAGPVYTVTTKSNFWQLPAMNFTDSGLAAGSTHSYTVRVSDPFANTTAGNATSVTLPGGTGGGGGTTAATDNFARTVSGGWGTATTGGAWAGTEPSALSVNNGVGSLAMSSPGSGPMVYLASLSSSSTDTTATVSADKVGTGTGTYLQVQGRRLSATADYRGVVKVLSNNTVVMQLAATTGGTQQTIAGPLTLAGVTYTPGLQLKTRLQVTGTNPTTVRMKLWPTTATEPTNWQLTATNSTAGLQSAGSVGFAAYLSGSTTNAPVTMQVRSFAVS